MGSRRRAREVALQLLYQLEFSPQEPLEEALGRYREAFGAPDGVWEFARQLVEGVRAHLPEIDDTLRRYSERWPLERMGAVDRNVLRLAVYELRWMPEIPWKVTINEAVEMGKRFGQERSGAFINGILDRIAKDLRGKGQG